MDCATKHFYQLTQLVIFLCSYALVYGIALKEILLQYPICPDAELSTTFGFNAIANRYNHIKAVNLSWLVLRQSIMQNLHITFFLQLAFLENIGDVTGNNGLIFVK